MSDLRQDSTGTQLPRAPSLTEQRMRSVPSFHWELVFNYLLNSVAFSFLLYSYSRKWSQVFLKNNWES